LNRHKLPDASSRLYPAREPSGLRSGDGRLECMTVWTWGTLGCRASRSC